MKYRKTTRIEKEALRRLGFPIQKRVKINKKRRKNEWKHKVDNKKLEVTVINFKNKEQIKDFVKWLKNDWE